MSSTGTLFSNKPDFDTDTQLGTDALPINNDINVKLPPMLEVIDLSISFTQYYGGLRQKTLKAVVGVSISICPGEVLAIVGSSGSGKSLLAHSILGILPRNAKMTGNIIYKGKELTAERQARLRGREIALVPQSVSYLDPLMRVGAQVRPSGSGKNNALPQRRVFDRYCLSTEIERLFPFQLSGGMARRILLSTATVSGAQLILADEPTPGLHPQVVKETLQHLRELADDGTSVILITHDIEAALPIADRIAVFYAGTVVEVAPAADFSGNGEALRHPYSKALWKALPQNGFAITPGFQPQPDASPSGCLFEPRCHIATPECAARHPEPRELNGGIVRCANVS